MAPRFDPNTRTLELAVADLLDARLLRSLGFANRGGYERMWLGQAIHSSYQEKALGDDPTYRREVTLKHRFEHQGWMVTIHGRLDGLRKVANDRWMVEEIKSIRRGAKLAPNVRELYEKQASLYAWLLLESEQREIPEGALVAAELILIEIGSDGVQREPVAFHPRAVAAGVRRRLNSLIKGYEAQQDARSGRHAAAQELAFPYDFLRKGQQEIIDDVERALEAREHLLIEAPTGIGKTVAALYPAVRYALANDKRIYVLTAKNLQQEMAINVLQLLNQVDAFRSLRLRNKARMCANDQVICHEEYCPFAREYYLKLQKSGVVRNLLDMHPTLLPDDIYDGARRAEVCPFEVSLELSHLVQAMVCDYNYAFDPYVGLSDFGADADLANTILVVDEIHNLVQRGRGYYSPTLSSETARQAGELMSMGGAPIHGELAGLCFDLEALLFETVSDYQPPGDPREWAFEAALPQDELWRLRPRLDQAFIDYLEFRRETHSLTADDAFVDLYFNVLKFLNALVVSDDAFSHYLERQGEDHRFRILCKDPSRFLGGIINRCHSVIGMSATLSPYSFYRDLLGFDAERTSPLQLLDTFPRENRQVVIDSTIETTWKQRPTYIPRIGERLAEFADAVPGNCLVLFPSYRFLSDVAGFLRPEQKRVLVQSPGDGAAQRQEILDTLRGAIFGDVLLLAVAGGVFAEGVDYPGDVLKAVAVVGPCLPAVTLEQQLLQTYYDERFDRGFEYAFVVPGMTRVVQAAGRLIRSPEDTGIILLLDKRFMRRPYKEHLPVDWVPEGGVREMTGDPSEMARLFFDSMG